jgi:pimeloyl-[acyl-carrier protein] methyl ester esterase
VIAPVVWVPGWSVGPEVFEDTWATLANRDHLGCHLESCSRSSELVEIVGNCTSKYSEPVDLVGWSMGAMVALEFVCRSPEHVRRLILISGSRRFVAVGCGTSGVPPESLDRMRAALPRNAAAVVRRFDQSMFTAGEYEGGYLAAWRAARRDRGYLAPSLDVGLQYLQEFAVDPTGVNTETHLLQGSADEICSVDGARMIESAMAESDLTIWPNVGHVPFYTQKELFQTWIRNLLQA